MTGHCQGTNEQTRDLLIKGSHCCITADVTHTGVRMSLRMRVHDREPIGADLRRFKKLLERSGVTKELRKRKYYEKPCEVRRRAELRKKSNIRKNKIKAVTPPSNW